VLNNVHKKKKPKKSPFKENQTEKIDKIKMQCCLLSFHVKNLNPKLAPAVGTEKRDNPFPTFPSVG
jgi:hypothetical protein